MRHLHPNPTPNGQGPADPAEPFAEAVSRALGRRVVASYPLAGGMIGEVRRVELDDGTKVIAKYADSPDARLDLEAGMLRHLRATDAVPVPDVYAADRHVLVMELMPGYPMGPSAEPAAGILLAGLHDVTGNRFGFDTDTLNGTLLLPHPPAERWVPFFRDQRLLVAAEAATGTGRLPRPLWERVDDVASRLDDLLEEPDAPSLLHGDVWASNILAEGDRVTAFLDPSLCYGHPEMELAYAATFGGFGAPLFDAYETRRVIAREFWTRRRHAYALYPALMHVYYFGDRYLPLLDSTLAMLGF